MLILAVANLKGGVGKSTTALNIAAALHRARHRVLLIDTTWQGTCVEWAAVAKRNDLVGPPVTTVEGRALQGDLDRLALGYDVVVIDTTSAVDKEMAAAMLAAHLVLIPVLPGKPDLDALNKMGGLPASKGGIIGEVRGLRPDLRWGFVLNRATRATLTSAARAALGQFKIPILGELGDRVAYGEATAQGMGVVDYAPTSKAASEMKDLVLAILGELGKRSSAKSKRARRDAA